MAEDQPTLDELRKRVAAIEAGEMPAKPKQSVKAKTSGLARRSTLQRKTPLRSRGHKSELVIMPGLTTST